jgi:Immunoglobulin I-set domain
MTPAAGTTVKLGCRSSGSPRPDVTWTKDGIDLSPIEGIMAADGRDVLLLPEVTQSDNGRYVCKVSNRAGAITRYYVINVDGERADCLTLSERNTAAMLDSV